MKSLKTFIKENRIRLDHTMVGENPNMSDWSDAYHYKVTLKMGRKQLTTYFSMGYGHDREPEAFDVLSCLLVDSNCPDSFEDFCDTYGYDTDSRRAYISYGLISKQSKKLRSFLGDKYMRAINCNDY